MRHAFCVDGYRDQVAVAIAQVIRAGSGLIYRDMLRAIARAAGR